LTVELGEAAYRRSEVSWRDASRPTATVTIDVEADDLVISIVVAKTEVHFAPACESNPLDNEPADINSDGAQIHLVVPGSLPESVLPVELTYVLVPEPGGSDVRITARSSGPPGPAPAVSWHPTATGYAMRCSIALAALGLQPGTRFGVGVIVNDMTPSRERRRGQLVLAEPDGEFVYLRGDRLPAARHLPFMIADA